MTEEKTDDLNGMTFEELLREKDSLLRKLDDLEQEIKEPGDDAFRLPQDLAFEYAGCLQFLSALLRHVANRVPEFVEDHEWSEVGPLVCASIELG